jgi:hypothetical protein
LLLMTHLAADVSSELCRTLLPDADIVTSHTTHKIR